MSALAQPPSPLVRADTLKISKNPKFFAPKSADVRTWRSFLPHCPQNVRMDKPPLPWLWTSFIDGPLPLICCLFEATKQRSS